MVGILFPILSEGKKMQNLTRYPDANDNKFLMGALTQFPVSFEFTYRIGNRYISNMKTCSEYHWNQNRNKAENKCCSLQ